MESYIEKLDNLIAQKKNKGHKITKAESEEYVTAWGELISTDKSFTPRAEQYLYDGIVFTAAKAFVSWILSAEDKFVALDCLFKGQLFGKDTPSTFRVLISTLAHLINSGVDEKDLVCPVMKYIPSSSKNKENKLIGDGPRIILNYFISEIDDSSKLPVLSELKSEPAIIASFVEVFGELCGRIDESSLSKKNKKMVLAVRSWLQPETETPTMDQQESEAELKKKDDEQVKPEKEKMEEDKTAPQEEDLFEQLANALNSASSIVERIRKSTEEQNISVREIIKDMRGENASLHRQIETLKEQEEALKRQLAEKNELIQTRIAQIEDLEKEISTLNLTLSAKEEEIQQRRQMIEALSRDREKQSDELVHRVAAKLKVEYMDFKDAESMPMDSDLGENMRFQLRSVFLILKKAGIPLE